VISFLLALVVHLQLLFSAALPTLWEFWNKLFPPRSVENITEISMVSISPQQWAENQKIKPVESPQNREQKKPQEPEQKPENDPKGQIVDVAPTPDNRPPDEARFLSEHNTRVEKESASRHRRPDYNVAQPRPTVADWQKKQLQQADDSPEQVVALAELKKGERQPVGEQKAEKLELPDIPRREELKLKLDLKSGTVARYQPSEQLRGNSDRLRLNLGEEQQQADQGDLGEGEKTLASLKMPSLKNLDLVSGAPANDHLEDLPKDEDTLLNSKEFKYATYFNRVKRSVSEHWRPADVYLRHDPYGNIYGVKDRFTIVSVQLDQEGKLDDLFLARSCGIDFLDDEAMRALRAASPFPNPPQGLIESDGKIRFQFGFYFEIGERPLLRTFRPRGPAY